MKTRNRSAVKSKLIPLLAVVAVAWTTQLAPAVMLKGSGDPSYNTTAPTGELAESGWQYQGLWGNFLGTPIAAQFFVAAKHVGGSVGDKFLFADNIYTTVGYWDDPAGGDLRIWKVDGVFPIWAPLYTQSDETGKPLVVIGRGTQRGGEVNVSTVLTTYTTNYLQTNYTLTITNYVATPNYSTNQVLTNYTVFVTSYVYKTNYATNVYSLKKLGLSAKQAQKLYPTGTIKGDTLTVVTTKVTTSKVVTPTLVSTNLAKGSTSWTTNIVLTTQVVADYVPVITSEVVTNLELKGWKAGAGDGVMRWGENLVKAAGSGFLLVSFDTDGNNNEASLSSGDSSGAVFIKEDGVWKLAGINYGIEGPFKVCATDASFYGAIFDKTGLYQQMPDDGIIRPACFYASRVSSNLGWMTSVLSQ